MTKFCRHEAMSLSARNILAIAIDEGVNAPFTKHQDRHCSAGKFLHRSLLIDPINKPCEIFAVIDLPQFHDSFMAVSNDDVGAMVMGIMTISGIDMLEINSRKWRSAHDNRRQNNEPYTWLAEKQPKNYRKHDGIISISLDVMAVGEMVGVIFSERRSW